MASYMYADVPEDFKGRSPCKCCRLDNNIDLPIPRPLTTDETRDLASRFSHSIFASWTQLNAILKRFEAVIHKRWMKKSFKQRLELLLKARPNMSQTHRPDFEPFRNMKRRGQARSSTCNAEAQLWHSINQEDLVKGNLLLLFLNSRGRNLPDAFTMHDLKQAHTGHGWKTKEDDGLRMVFLNRCTPRRYGQLVKATELRSGDLKMAFDDKASGLLVLEIQESIYSFLLQSAKLVMHDLAPSEVYLAPHQPTPQVPTNTSDRIIFRSASTHTLEAPYHLPQHVDLAHMRHIVGSRVQVAQDHLWSLREDPAYFLEQLTEWQEHMDSRSDSLRGPCWGQISNELISDAFAALIIWTRMEGLLLNLRPLDSQLALVDETTLRFHPADEFGWTMILLLIRLFIERLMIHLRVAIPNSPRLRACYRTPHSKCDCPDECVEGCESGWNMRSSSKASRAELRVDRIFYMMVDSQNRKTHSLKHLVEEAQYMLDTDTDASALLDSWLVERFSDLAVLVNLKHRILSMYPWSKYWDTGDIEYRGLADALWLSLNTNHTAMTLSIGAACKASKVLGKLPDSMFNYPVDKRRTKETVKQMRTAEQNLERFWEDVQAKTTAEGCYLANCAFELLERDFNDVSRTPEWTRDEELAASAARARKADTAPEPEYTLPATPEPANKRSDLPIYEKLKLKTRGLPQPDLPITPPATPSAQILEPITLPCRVYHVLSSFLPTSATATQTVREIAWDEFLYAFNAIGLVPEKLYGSVWIFKPVPPGEGLVTVQRSIQFHEPKEVRRGNKISAVMVRKFGRRLKRAFGWEGEMFVQE